MLLDDSSECPLRHHWGGPAKRKPSKRLTKFQARAAAAVQFTRKQRAPVSQTETAPHQPHQSTQHSQPRHAHVKAHEDEEVFVEYAGGVVMLYARNGRMCDTVWSQLPAAARQSVEPRTKALGWMNYCETLVCELLRASASCKPAPEEVSKARTCVQKLLDATVAAEECVSAPALAELRLCCAACRLFVLVLDGNATQAAVTHIEMSLCLAPQTGALQLLCDVKRKMLKLPEDDPLFDVQTRACAGKLMARVSSNEKPAAGELGTQLVTSAMAQMVCAAVSEPSDQVRWFRSATAALSSVLAQLMDHELGWLVVLIAKCMLNHIDSQLPSKCRKMKLVDDGQFDGVRLRQQAVELIAQLQLLGPSWRPPKAASIYTPDTAVTKKSKRRRRLVLQGAGMHEPNESAADGLRGKEPRGLLLEELETPTRQAAAVYTYCQGAWMRSESPSVPATCYANLSPVSTDVMISSRFGVTDAHSVLNARTPQPVDQMLVGSPVAASSRPRSAAASRSSHAEKHFKPVWGHNRPHSAVSRSCGPQHVSWYRQREQQRIGYERPLYAQSYSANPAAADKEWDGPTAVQVRATSRQCRSCLLSSCTCARVKSPPKAIEPSRVVGEGFGAGMKVRVEVRSESREIIVPNEEPPEPPCAACAGADWLPHSQNCPHRKLTFDDLDINNDGVVTREEWLEATGKQKAAQKAAHEAAEEAAQVAATLEDVKQSLRSHPSQGVAATLEDVKQSLRSHPSQGVSAGLEDMNVDVPAPAIDMNAVGSAVANQGVDELLPATDGGLNVSSS